MRTFIFLLFSLFFAATGVDQVYGQAAGWTAHTSMREVTAVSTSDDMLWVSTTGGVFSFKPEGGEVRPYTIADGLHGIRVRDITFDASCGDEGCVWFAYGDGVLERLDVASGSIQSYFDIARAERFPTRTINRLVIHGDTLLVATSFGLVIFDPTKGEVRDSYEQFDGMAPAIPVHDVVVAPAPSGGDALWLATDQGVAFAPMSAINLKDPGAWTVEQAGLPSVATRSIAVYDNRLYVGTEQGVAVRSPDGIYQALPMTSRPVTDLYVARDVLIGIERFNLLVIRSSGASRSLTSTEFQDPTDVVLGPDGMLWIGDQNEGLIQAEFPDVEQTSLNVVQRFYPSGPYHNLFEQLDFDKDGSLWAAGAYGTGFYKKSPDGVWTDYIGRNFSELQGRASFTVVHAGINGHAWAGSEGSGLVEVSPENAVNVYTRQNSTLRGAQSTTNPDYILIGGISTDKDGRLWVTNPDTPGPLHVRQDGTGWTSLPVANCTGLPAGNATYRDIYIDSFDQKWIIVTNERPLNNTIGLIVLDTGSSPTDPNDDTCKLFRGLGAGGQGLPSEDVRDVVEDKNGYIWIGTGKGLAYVVNTSVISSDQTAVPLWPLSADRATGQYLFRGLAVNDVAVDPANRLWVATENGAYLVQAVEAGYEVVYHFTRENSPLLSNEVRAIAVDERTGEVYIATVEGLVSFQGDAIAPAEQPGDLLVYPNPVRSREGVLPDIYVEGLVDETEVLVLAPHGEVVTRFPGRGGRVRWDGRDLNGEYVPSGVYLVVAVGQDGEQTAYGKVAIIR